MTDLAEGLPLSDVSATMLLTLYCHVQASTGPRPLLHDPQSVRIWEALKPDLARSGDPRVRRLLSERIPRLAVTYVALRARRVDRYATEFLARHPRAQIVSLGCGLDPRFSRIDNGTCRFTDVDLPSVITLKRRFVPESERYRMLAASVTDPQWVEGLPDDEGPRLFLAEGLFMYLREAEIRSLVRLLQARFPGSELVCEVLNRRWLSPWLGGWVRAETRRQLGMGPDATFRFGLSHPREMETWGPGIRFLDDWAYLDEPVWEIGWVKAGAWNPFFRTTQWLVHYRLEAPDGAPLARVARR